MNTKLCPACSAPIPDAAPGGFCPACLLRDAAEPVSTGRPAPALEEVAAAFPSLEIGSLIGQGGMGSVYQVRQPNLDRVVALKILAPELSRDPAFAERFAREARVLGKLNHPNIVSVYEHGVSQPSTASSQPFYYLIMEYVDGVNLRQAMRAGRFTPEQALAIVPGICDALQAAHAQGIWHRDIKPENILLDQRGGVKIADFGIARLVGDQTKNFTLTGTGNALGSIAYMAPEQHERPHTVDHRADIYSLGVVIYEMLTGELPLGRFPAPSQRAAVNTRIDEIVFRTLEKERELRQQSATEVKTDVEESASSEGNRPPVPPIAKMPLVRIGEIFCGGVTLKNPAAIRAANWLTAPVWLGMLGFLGQVPGWERMRGFFGFFGFAGFFAVAWFIENLSKQNPPTSPRPGNSSSRFPAPSKRAAVSALVDEVVHQTLEKERELRQQSTQEVKNDVGSVGDFNGHASVNRKTSAPQSPTLERPARLTVISILLVVVCGILLFPAALAMSQGDARDITVSLLAVAVLMGYAAAWVALSYMKSDHISKGWRGGLRVFAWTPIFALAGAPIVAGMIYAFATAERDRTLALIQTDAGQSESELRTFPVAITEAKRSGLSSGDESWAYTPRHMTAGEVEIFIKTPAGKSSKALDKTRDFGWRDGMTTQFSEGKFTLTGPGDQVRPLMTWLRMMDISKVPPAGYKGELPPETLAMAALAALMVHNEYDEKMFSSSFSKTLQAEHITAPQLGRAIRHHVLEFENITVAGKPKSDSGRANAFPSPATYEVTVPCADQKDQPLTITFVELDLGFRKEQKFVGLSPWLLEEAKKQSAEPFVADNALTPTPKPPPFLEWAQGEWVLDREESERATATLYPGGQDNSPGTAALREEEFKPHVVAFHVSFSPGRFEFWEVRNPNVPQPQFSFASGNAPLPESAKTASPDQLTFTGKKEFFNNGSSTPYKVDEIRIGPFSKTKDGLLQWTIEKPSGVKYVKVFRRHDAKRDGAAKATDDSTLEMQQYSIHRDLTSWAMALGDVESWSYTLRHLDATRLDEKMKANPQAGITTKVDAGVVTLTGPRDPVRQLATMLRVIDQPEVKNPLELPLLNMPPEFFTRMAIPVLMSGKEFSDTQFEPAFFETLKRENITAPQLARALRAHVLELEKATYVNTGTPFESIVHTPGASTYYDATIPCADQPDKPLTFRIRRTTQQFGTKPDIAGFAPWLIEEAKLQSKEPLVAPNAVTPTPQSTQPNGDK